MNSSMNAPIISIVIPMYNVARYINFCLDSVLAQSFPYFEIICVDDGCSDNTVEIVKEYNDPRIVLVQQANLGLSAARNTGFSIARGDYIAMLDADDGWHADKLKLHVAHLNQSKHIDVSFSAAELMDENNNVMGLSQCPKTNNITARDTFLRNPVSNGSNAVFRRSSLKFIPEAYNNKRTRQDDVTQLFDESLRQSEDIECWLRICLNTKLTFQGIPQKLTLYRINTAGLSANLEKQFNSWHLAVSKHANNHPTFIYKYYSLAKAFQLRYLCRRAVHSYDRKQSITLILRALIVNPKILLLEPCKTIITFLSACILLLPTRLYASIESYYLQKMKDLNQT